MDFENSAARKANNLVKILIKHKAWTERNTVLTSSCEVGEIGSCWPYCKVVKAYRMACSEIYKQQI